MIKKLLLGVLVLTIGAPSIAGAQKRDVVSKAVRADRDYWSSNRMRRARDMLTLTDLPLIDVAERSGFNYQEYLTYIFNKHLNTTPAQYRSRTSATS